MSIKSMCVRQNHALEWKLPSVSLCWFSDFCVRVRAASTPTKYKAQENQLLFPIYFGEELFFLFFIISCIENTFGAYKTLLVVCSSAAACRRLSDPVHVYISIT